MVAEPRIPSLDDGSWITGGATPHHDPGGAQTNLVTVADVDHLLSWHLLPVPEVAYLARNGETLPPDRYAKHGAAMHAAAGAPGITWQLTTLDVDRTIDELADGATLSITSVQRQLPAVESLLRRLSVASTAECSANLYLSGPGASGGLHHDLHDVLVLQLAGAKSWQVHERTGGWRDPATMGRAGPAFARYELTAGDALHLPAGWPHLVRTPDDGWSLHLTVALRPLTADRLGVDDVLRHEGPSALDGAALRDPSRFAESLAQTWTAAHQLPEEPGPLEALRARAIGIVHRSGPPAGRLLAATGRRSLSPSAQLVPRWVPWTFRRARDGVVLHAGGRSLTLPPGADAVLAPLLEGRALGVVELIELLGDAGAEALVRALTATGFVRSEDPDEARRDLPPEAT